MFVNEGERVTSGNGFTRGLVDDFFVGEGVRAGWAMRGTNFRLGDSLGGIRRERLFGLFVREEAGVEGLLEEDEDVRAVALMITRFRARRCFSALADNDMVVTGLLHSGMVAPPTKVGSEASRTMADKGAN